MKGTKTLRLFYNGKCIRSMSKDSVMKPKTDKILIPKYKFDCSKADLFPEFNEGFEYVYVDEQIDERDVMSVNRETVTIMTYDAIPDEYEVLTTEYEVETPVLISAGDIITRSIHSENYPTKMIFGNTSSASNKSKSLIEIIYMDTQKITTMDGMFGFCKT